MENLRISEVAERTGVPTTTLRYYEDIGLIGPTLRSANGYRIYDERDLERLKVISRAKKLDISLDDVRNLVEAWEGDECDHVQHRLGGIVAARLQHTRGRIAELKDLANQLEQVRSRLSVKPQDGPCTDDCACAEPTREEAEAFHTNPPAGATVLPLLPMSVLETPSGGGASCTLERDALPTRLAEWNLAVANATARTTLDDGIVLDFALNPELAASIARLAAEECECCTFFNFTLTVSVIGLRLEVRAPAEAQDALHAVFGATRNESAEELSVSLPGTARRAQGEQRRESGI